MEDVGVITLVYPSDAQSKDETVAYATRRAREPVAEEDDPYDSETPIGSIRTVGARLRELTAAVEEQRKQIELIASREDGNEGELLEVGFDRVGLLDNLVGLGLFLSGKIVSWSVTLAKSFATEATENALSWFHTVKTGRTRRTNSGSNASVSLKCNHFCNRAAFYS